MYTRTLPIRLYNTIDQTMYLLGGGGGGYHNEGKELYGWNIAADKDNYTMIKDNNEVSPSNNWERIEEYSWLSSFYIVCIPNPLLSNDTESQSFINFTTMIKTINTLSPPPRAIIVLGQLIEPMITKESEKLLIFNQAMNIISTYVTHDTINIILQIQDTFLTSINNIEIPCIPALPSFIPQLPYQYTITTQWIQGCRMYYKLSPSEHTKDTEYNIQEDYIWLQKDISVMRSVAQHSLLWYHTVLPNKVQDTLIDTPPSTSNLNSSLATLINTILKEENGHNIRYIITTHNEETTDNAKPPYRSKEQYVDGETDTWQPLRKKEIQSITSCLPDSMDNKPDIHNNSKENESNVSSPSSSEYPVKIIRFPSLTNLCSLLSKPSIIENMTTSTSSSLSSNASSSSPVSSSTSLLYIPTIKLSSLRLEPGYIKVDLHQNEPINVTLLPNEK